MRFKTKVDQFWYCDNYDDVRVSKLNPEYHYKNYGIAEERIPNPYYEIKSFFYKSLFLFLNSLNIRLSYFNYLNNHRFCNLKRIVIRSFFLYEYRFLKDLKNKRNKIYITSWVGGGVADAAQYYIRKDLQKYDNIIMIRSLKNISQKEIPLFKVEIYSKIFENSISFICPFPSGFLIKLLVHLNCISEIDIHHVFGFEKFINFIQNNFIIKFNFYVHDYYLFSENWSFFNVDISSSGHKTSYFQTQINNIWPIALREVFLRNCNSIIATSYHTFKLLYNEKDFPIEKLEFKYIPEESNLEFNQLNSPVEILGENRRIKIIVLGNLGIYKGLTILNNIADKLKFKNFEFKIYHFGNVSEAKLNDAIVSYGWLNKNERGVEIKKLDADLAILPAQSPETYSLILSELIRLKIPIVSSKIGALTERIFDRKNAHLVSDYKSSESWVNEIINFCKNNFTNDNINSDFSADEIKLIYDKRLRS
jgi:hypothetical protein